jgi:hypothetical protein
VATAPDLKLSFLSDQCLLVQHVAEQHGLENDCGAVVWDAALVLVNYLAKQVERGSLDLRGKRVIELGAGTGTLYYNCCLCSGCRLLGVHAFLSMHMYEGARKDSCPASKESSGTSSDLQLGLVANKQVHLQRQTQHCHVHRSNVYLEYKPEVLLVL